jgi:hypothetical protein
MNCSRDPCLAMERKVKSRRLHPAKTGPACRREAQARIPAASVDRGPMVQVLLVESELRDTVPFENTMSRYMRKAVARAEVVLTLLGTLMVLVTLTNPSAIAVETALLLIGFLMIAIASFAGL